MQYTVVLLTWHSDAVCVRVRLQGEQLHIADRRAVLRVLGCRLLGLIRDACHQRPCTHKRASGLVPLLWQRDGLQTPA